MFRFWEVFAFSVEGTLKQYIHFSDALASLELIIVTDSRTKTEHLPFHFISDRQFSHQISFILIKMQNAESCTVQNYALSVQNHALCKIMKCALYTFLRFAQF